MSTAFPCTGRMRQALSGSRVRAAARYAAPAGAAIGTKTMCRVHDCESATTPQLLTSLASGWMSTLGCDAIPVGFGVGDAPVGVWLGAATAVPVGVRVASGAAVPVRWG